MPYFSTTPSPTAFGAFTEANPFFALWMLPFTLTQTWIAAWSGSNGSDAERLADGGAGEQIPVPAPIQESKDSNVYA